MEPAAGGAEHDIPYPSSYGAIKEEDQVHSSTLRANTEPVTRADLMTKARYRKSVTADNSNQDAKDL